MVDNELESASPLLRSAQTCSSKEAVIGLVFSSPTSVIPEYVGDSALDPHPTPLPSRKIDGTGVGETLERRSKSFSEILSDYFDNPWSSKETLVVDAIEQEMTLPTSPKVSVLCNPKDVEVDDGDSPPCFLRVPSFFRARNDTQEMITNLEQVRLDLSDSLRHSWRGDLGLALFHPLDTESFNPVPIPISMDEDNSTSKEEEEEEEEFMPLMVFPEDASSLQSAPRILNENMMIQIRDGGLPPAAKIMSWKRIYSTRRDGDCFYTMLRSCEQYCHTVFVILTTSGDILGGYADKPWAKQRGRNLGGSYYGGGRTSLFATNPAVVGDVGTFGGRAPEPEYRMARDISEGERVHIYRWTGENTFSQIFNARTEKMAMGGGGSFGIKVEDNFSRGTTGCCSTFDNPPLTKDSGGCFEIAEFELYGLRSALSVRF